RRGADAMTRRFGALAATGLVAAALVVTAFVLPATSGPAAARWRPKPGSRWQYQLQGKVDTAICAKPARGGACVRPGVFVIDLYTDNGTTTNAAAVKRIHARTAHAVCYVDAGTWENWRPDASKYPTEIRGKSNGWPGERWLDIRAIKALKPLIAARVDK